MLMASLVDPLVLNVKTDTSSSSPIINASSSVTESPLTLDMCKIATVMDELSSPPLSAADDSSGPEEGEFLEHARPITAQDHEVICQENPTEPTKPHTSDEPTSPTHDAVIEEQDVMSGTTFCSEVAREFGSSAATEGSCATAMSGDLLAQYCESTRAATSSIVVEERDLATGLEDSGHNQVQEDTEEGTHTVSEEDKDELESGEDTTTQTSQQRTEGPFIEPRSVPPHLRPALKAPAFDGRVSYTAQS